MKKFYTNQFYSILGVTNLFFKCTNLMPKSKKIVKYKILGNLNESYYYNINSHMLIILCIGLFSSLFLEFQIFGTKILFEVIK